jgi:hypothetical protein
MQKYGYRKPAAYMLCQKAHEECGSSWNGELPKETIGHIQSAGCLGQKEVVTATHNDYRSIHTEKSSDSALRPLIELFIKYKSL